jgi:sulfur-oxidizing protein SoxY
MQNRRSFLKSCVIALNVAVVGLMETIPSWAADAQNDKALEAKDTAGALAALGVQSPSPGKRILLDVPEIADEKETISIKVKSAIPNTDWIAVLVDKNPHPFIGQFDLVAKATSIETKVKLAQTSMVVAVVRADGKYYRVDKEVKVAVAGSCE